MKKSCIGLLAFLSFFGCVKETEWINQGSLPDLIIVDGMLTDIQGSQVIKLRYPVSSLNEIPKPVTGANVIINTEDSSFVLSESTLVPGNYLTRGNFIATAGKTYTLLVFQGDKSFTAKAQMAEKINFDPLIYQKNSEDMLYHVDFVASAFETGNPAMWEVLMDWSMVPGYTLADTATTRARLLFYTLPTIDVTEIFAPEMEKVSFPAGTVIEQRRYSLTPEHAEFIRALLSETNWQGGLFGTTQANVSTNLSNGAKGFFGVCAVSRLSFIVATKK